MKSKSFPIYFLFVLIAVISFLVSTHTLLPHFVWINEPLHSTAEAFGTLAAIFMAIMLLHRKHEEGGERLFRMAIGLLSMGLLLGFHSVARIGHGFVLLYSLACLSGGFWFALVWLPEFESFSHIRKGIPWVVAAGSILLGCYTLLFRETMPLMVEGGKFTLTAILMNLLAGVLFLAATGRFLLDFQRSGKIEPFLFSCMAFLFGLANLSFPFSGTWDDTWWFWHLLRVLAFLLALWFVLRKDQQMISILKSTIIECKKTEEEAQEREKEFRNLVEEAPLAITVVNKAGELEYINRKNVEVLGYTRNETPTLELWWSLAYSNPEERKKVTALWGDIRHRVLSGENIGATERKITCKDGTVKDVELRFARAGEKVLVIFNDITERKKAEETRKTSQRFLESMINSIADIFYVFDTDGKFVLWNKALEQVTGYSHEEVSKMCSTDLFDKEDAINIKASIKRVFEKGFNTAEESLLTKDGRKIPMFFSGSMSKDTSGRPILCGTGKDITERKQAEEALQRYSTELAKNNKELQEALANVKTLSGMLPICASCKKIRDDKGYWSYVETYVSKHTEAVFTSGICPECEKKMYEELEKLKNEDT